MTTHIFELTVSVNHKLRHSQLGSLHEDPHTAAFKLTLKTHAKGCPGENWLSGIDGCGKHAVPYELLM